MTSAVRIHTRMLVAAVAAALLGLTSAGFAQAATSGQSLPPGFQPAGTPGTPIPFNVTMGGLSNAVGAPIPTACPAGETGSQSGTYQLVHTASGWVTEPDVTASTCAAAPPLTLPPTKVPQPCPLLYLRTTLPGPPVEYECVGVGYTRTVNVTAACRVAAMTGGIRESEEEEEVEAVGQTGVQWAVIGTPTVISNTCHLPSRTTTPAPAPAGSSCPAGSTPYGAYPACEAEVNLGCTNGWVGQRIWEVNVVTGAQISKVSNTCHAPTGTTPSPGPAPSPAPTPTPPGPTPAPAPPSPPVICTAGQTETDTGVLHACIIGGGGLDSGRQGYETLTVTKELECPNGPYESGTWATVNTVVTRPCAYAN